MWYYEGGIRIEPDWNVKTMQEWLSERLIN